MRYHRPAPAPSSRPPGERPAPGPAVATVGLAGLAAWWAAPGFLYARLADLTMLVHLAFVLFVVLGALLLLWRRWIAWIHVPCAAYGVAIEFAGWVCPLTPLENRLRQAAGQAGYAGGFIEHYVGGLLYPKNWGQIHVLLGVLLIMLNAFLYAWILTRRTAKEA